MNFQNEISKEIIAIVVILLLSYNDCLQIKRLTYGGEIDSYRGNLFRSYDFFSNRQRYEGDCTKRNSTCLTENCEENTCCKCKCNDGLTFLSYKYGCVSPEDVNNKTGQECKFKFNHQTAPVIPAFKDNQNDLINAAGVALGTMPNTLPATVSLGDSSTICVAGFVYEITSRGLIRILDQNRNSSLFEVQQVPVGFTSYKGLFLTDRIFSTWKKLEGRLISLEIVCFNEEEKLSLSSCLLFKVNGTITDGKTPVQTVTTNLPTMKTFKSSTVRQGSVSTELLVNTTAVPVSSKKEPVPIGAIIGAVFGVLLLITCIIVIWLVCKKRKERPKSTNKEMPCAENGNDASHYPRDSMKQNHEILETENPYYKGVTDETTSNDYHDPMVVFKTGKTPDENGVYYSSADVLKNTKEPKRSFEYSYARGTGKDPPGAPGPDGEERYEKLGISKANPGIYQALDAGKTTCPDESALAQENPYYEPAKASDSLLEKDRPKPSKGLSLKNNPGSRENVAFYHVLDPEEDQDHYQGPTIPGKTEYVPVKQEEYLDMSCGDRSDDEYMYACP